MPEGEDFELLKSRFLKAFASVPFPLRTEIIAVVDNQPVSWAAAYGEITQSTPKSKMILEQLKKIGLL